MKRKVENNLPFFLPEADLTLSAIRSKFPSLLKVKVGGKIMSSCKVGKVKEAHGLRGDLYILVFSKDVSWAQDLKTFELGPENGDRKSYTVEKCKPYKDGLILKSAAIGDRTAAELVRGQMFFIPEKLLESDEGETIYLNEIDGFQVQDPQGQLQGTIVGFSSNIAQDLLIVERPDGKRAEIPFVEDFIVEINFEGRVLRLDLPEGIWDLDAL